MRMGRQKSLRVELETYGELHCDIMIFFLDIFCRFRYDWYFLEMRNVAIKIYVRRKCNCDIDKTPWKYGYCGTIGALEKYCDCEMIGIFSS